MPRVPPALPLGSLGTLPDGLPYRIVGYMLRKEVSTPARWLEYVLFNPTAGYAQLATYEGHWTFIKPTEQQYAVTKGQAGQHAYVEAEGSTYDIYNEYTPRILYAVGEFDYDILADEALLITEYVAPPTMLVQEQERGSSSVRWYRAEHIEPATVAAAFGVGEVVLPYRNGVGAIQPAPGAASWPALKSLTLWTILLLILTQLAFVIWRPEKQLLRQDFSSGMGSVPNPAVAVENNALVLVSLSFPVAGPAALVVEVKAGVDNSWVELPVRLVNEQTGQGYEFTKSIEYYHGYEGGENWSEGSVEGDATLARVPTGRYHLKRVPDLRK